MSGPSGENTKASKIDRILTRQGQANTDIENIYALIRLGHEKDTATIEQLTATNALLADVAYRLEAENARLRKYLGSVLFKRRQLMAGTASLSDVCRQEPKWGNR